ncbi:6-phosphofructo-2-kinase [Schizosaccharomyces cryophilus OY26]|uniref:6-phosphofructo-2-kinase n=1 Tax=Schizosaccharomyces cryophilus (strain OY26 / ATCC MYA-4695 / CBS 11777 / NBRC 106824 / NRRL Y48691) TaxID=653667 RepID=S9VWZ5_SCHCR|nr:6-phosphofructo-2-kinase [Schizosaccharomyces cryophilus OY26]EPY50764.1 6-phosphofructo-2-kinase [Schizosaccharomyces cryophilus OY26]
MKQCSLNKHGNGNLSDSSNSESNSAKESKKVQFSPEIVQPEPRNPERKPRRPSIAATREIHSGINQIPKKEDIKLEDLSPKPPLLYDVKKKANTSELFPSIREEDGGSTPLGVKTRKIAKHQIRQESTIDIPGLTVSRKAENEMNCGSYGIREKLVIVLVGIPATGKSYIGSKLVRYYNWLRYNCRFFSVGDKRREEGASKYSMSAPFFDFENQELANFREYLAMETLENLLRWLLNENGVIGVLDATNSTFQRRKLIYDRISQEEKLGIMFLESVCTDEALFQQNMVLKARGPDYEGFDAEEALVDLQKRVELYRKYYEPIDEREEGLPFLQYVKVINVGIKVITHNIEGFLTGQAVYFMLNLNIRKRQIWLTRPGESNDTIAGRVGGDAPLTDLGVQYAEDLAKFVDRQRVLWQLRETTERLNSKKLSFEEEGFNVWSSVRQRAVETSQFFNPAVYDVKKMRMLNDLNFGSHEGLTLKEFAENFPEEYRVIQQKDVSYRFSGLGGESYLDVVHRLQPIIVELERSSANVLVIAHRVVSNILMTYFLNYSPEEIIDVGLPLHTLYCIESDRYSTVCKLYNYDAEERSFVRVSE